jgi:NOL1/NOP2/sun family putative RNA methylase
MPEWKPKFIERYSKLTDIDKFLNISLKPLRKSIRVNPLKTTISEMKKRFKLQQVPWCKEGFWTEGYALGNTPEHFMGYFYIQEAASMIPPEVLSPKLGDMVLDMCAAPGSKTSQMAAMMKNQGLIVANDVNFSRLKPLTINLQRCGVANVVMSVMHGRHFKNLSFDKILVDAPCSGIGTIRKSPRTIQTWNPNLGRMMCGIQKQLASAAFNILKPGGTMVYSTCTLEPEENEGVVDFLLNKFPELKLQKIDLKIKKSPPIEEFEGTEYSSEVKKCLRIWPQDNDTEGFFVAKFRKD